jgi:hypothetical protein
MMQANGWHACDRRARAVKSSFAKLSMHADYVTEYKSRYSASLAELST